MTKTRWFGRKRGLPIAGGVVLAVGLFACGGSGNDCTNHPTGPGCIPPATTLPPAVRTPIQTESGSLPARTVVRSPFTTPRNGTLDITVDWTFASSPIGVYVVREACTIADFNARTCKFVTTSETTQKPRKISLPSFTAGTYELLIANFANVDESVSYEIGLTTGGGASSASTGRSGARDPRISGDLGAIVTH